MQEESTSCFNENPNFLKLVLDISSNGHKGSADSSSDKVEKS